MIPLSDPVAVSASSRAAIVSSGTAAIAPDPSSRRTCRSSSGGSSRCSAASVSAGSGERCASSHQSRAPGASSSVTSAAAIRDALRRARPHARDPLALLRVAAGADLAVLTGFLLQAAVRRTPVLLDGLVAVAAALVTDELAPGARDWWLLAQRSPEPALTLAAEHLELPPLLDLHVRLDDGSGAVAAVPLLTMAARLLAETATGSDSGIVPDARVGV